MAAYRSVPLPRVKRGATNLLPCVPLDDPWMLLHRVDQPQQFGEGAEHVARNVIDRSLEIRSDSDEQLQIGHAQLCPGQVRPSADLTLDGSAPLLQIALCGLLSCPLLLHLVLDADDRPHPHPHILDGAHQRLVHRGLERLGRVESMLRTDEAQDGIGLRELPALVGEHRQRAEGRARLARGPLIAVQPFILEGDAREVERQTALFAPAGGCVEVGQLVRGHRRASGSGAAGARLPDASVWRLHSTRRSSAAPGFEVSGTPYATQPANSPDGITRFGWVVMGSWIWCPRILGQLLK